MILIVDDNQENIFSLKSLLVLHKFAVDTASSGEEALKKILQKRFSLIILDVQMPDMDGFEVAEAISGYSKSKDIPIIFLSAINTHKKYVAKGYDSGGIDYVTKPFDPDILLLKVKTFYRLSEQTRSLNELEEQLREEIAFRKQSEILLEKKVEERTHELKKSNQRLEQNNKELAQFAFVASHDLQEPLRKIETFSNIVLTKHLNDPERLQSYLQRISSSAHRLRDLINDLLHYSRINAEEDFKKTNLNIVVKETLDDVAYDPEGRTEIVVHPLPEVEVIPSQMRQLFQNLISNSLKFSRNEIPCRITIAGERVSGKDIDSVVDPEGDYCRITIRDNGIGFNNEYNDRIFEIFQRLNDSELYEGSGIGLAIVKKIIQRHEGAIYANGKENEGATFVIVLPVEHRLSSLQKLVEK